MNHGYQNPGPSRAELDALPGSVMVEFGTSWCGWCRGAQPLIEAALADFPGVARVRIEDGKGRPSGRSYGVRLWPTLVFLSDGQEVARVVRPGDVATVSRALALFNAADR